MKLRSLIAAAAFAVSSLGAGAQTGHFAWGADAGGAIDLSGHDMSTLNLDAYFGYRGGVIDMAGVGAGLNIPVNNSRREFPVYGMVRSSFSHRPRPMFFELRSGVVFNSHPDSDTDTRADFYISPGVGFRLAFSRIFTSYIVVGYIYNGLHTDAGLVNPDNPSSGPGDGLSRAINGLHSAVIRLGINF